MAAGEVSECVWGELTLWRWLQTKRQPRLDLSHAEMDQAIIITEPGKRGRRGDDVSNYSWQAKG